MILHFHSPFHDLFLHNIAVKVIMFIIIKKQFDNLQVTPLIFQQNVPSSLNLLEIISLKRIFFNLINMME